MIQNSRLCAQCIEIVGELDGSAERLYQNGNPLAIEYLIGVCLRHGEPDPKALLQKLRTGDLLEAFTPTHNLYEWHSNPSSLNTLVDV